jgi:hypothetical protein
VERLAAARKVEVAVENLLATALVFTLVELV